MKDFYYILGTERDCTPTELNSAYRTLAQKLQPNGQAPDAFLDGHLQEVTEAYLVLSDPLKRRKYDAAYKKSYLRRSYYFRLSYVNIAVTLTLIGFTALFGMYVTKVLSGRPAKPAVAKPVMVAHNIVHHKKKKHKIIAPVTKSVTAQNTPPKYTAVKKPEQPVVDKPAYTPAVKGVPPPVAPAPTTNTDRTVQTRQPSPPPVIAATPKDETPADNSYSTYLKANVTGLVSLHQQDNYRSAVVVNIPNNSKVQVLQKGQGFYKISYNGQTGYVPKWTVADQ